MTDDLPTGALPTVTAAIKRPWVTPQLMVGGLAEHTENASNGDTDGEGGGTMMAS